MHIRHGWFSLPAVIAATMLVTASAFGAQAQSQDDIAMAKRFVGMWRLVSRAVRYADGTARQSPNSAGYIIYTDTDPVRMCYVAMNPNLPKWKSDRKTPTPTPEEAVIANFNAYCSTVEVHAKESFVLHHVEVAAIPNLVGRIRKRHFTFEGPNRVALRIDASELDPPVIEDILTWERVR